MVMLSFVAGATPCGTVAALRTGAQDAGAGLQPQAAKMGQGPRLQPALGARICGRQPATDAKPLGWRRVNERRRKGQIFGSRDSPAEWKDAAIGYRTGAQRELVSAKSSGITMTKPLVRASDQVNASTLPREPV